MATVGWREAHLHGRRAQRVEGAVAAHRAAGAGLGVAVDEGVPVEAVLRAPLSRRLQSQGSRVIHTRALAICQLLCPVVTIYLQPLAGQVQRAAQT